jgi:outer membrane protein OmpA-like peptidoglycan-associated protein
MKNKIQTLFIIFSCFFLHVYSQSFKNDSLIRRSYFGLITGINFSSFRYTDKNLEEYNSSILGNQMLGMFLETSIKNNLSLRSQFLYIGKGQKINDIGISYKLKSKYYEFRFPVQYSFLKGQIYEPYVFLGPTFSFAIGGKSTYEGINVNVTNADIAAFDVGYVTGVGLKMPLKVFNVPSVFATEVAYNRGLLDTYGKKEKAGTATAQNLALGESYTIDGKRKNNGFEISVSLAMPLNINASKSSYNKKTKPKNERIQAVTNVPKNDCYEIEEILSFLKSGIDVNDKKICMYNLGFEFDKSLIDKPSMNYLNQIVQLLQTYPAITMKIIGHTDSLGTESYNMKLSKERSYVVYSYLIKNKVNPSRLSYEYFGAQVPISTNETEEGRAKNRRVEFIIRNGIIKVNKELPIDTIHP